MNRTVRPLRRLALATGCAVGGVLLFAVPAFAQVVPDPQPDATLPGGALITQVLGWLKYASDRRCGGRVADRWDLDRCRAFRVELLGVIGRPEVDSRWDRRGDDRRAGPFDRHNRLQRDLTDAPFHRAHRRRDRGRCRRRRCKSRRVTKGRGIAWRSGA